MAAQDKNNQYSSFIERLIEFDKSISASFIPRLLSQKGNMAEIISHALDRYMLGTGKECVILTSNVYDSAYERHINMVSHNVDNGHIIAHFTTGGFADFLNLSMMTMIEIAYNIMNAHKCSEQ